jgi:hypothetical protein
VLSEVESFFGVNIQMDGMGGKNFTGSIETGNLENVLLIITGSLQLEYVFEDKYNIKLLN